MSPEKALSRNREDVERGVDRLLARTHSPMNISGAEVFLEFVSSSRRVRRFCECRPLDD